MSQSQAQVSGACPELQSRIEVLMEKERSQDKAIRKLRESLERERNARAQAESKYRMTNEKVSKEGRTTGSSRAFCFGSVVPCSSSQSPRSGREAKEQH